MKNRSGEVAELVDRRGLDFCCLQETRWTGETARTIGSEGKLFKVYYKGCKKGTAGVGIMVAERWINKAIEVKRFTERIMLLRVLIGKTVVCLVSVYAPQAGLSYEEKEDFYASLGKVLLGVETSDKLFVCGDLNAHVGALKDGFEGVHGGKGYGSRNEEGEMLLEFADAMQLVILNTWFQKDKSRLVTFESAGNRTVVDYMLVRKCNRTLVTNVKVAQNEECIPQHKLIVCNVVMRESLKKKKAAFVSKCKVWKLQDADVGKRFEEKVKRIAAARIKGTVESEWNSMKDCMLSVAEEVCGKTKGRDA